VEDGAFESDYFDANYGGDYDARNPAYKFRALLGAIRMHQPSGRLLDIGCAYGKFLEVAADEGGYTLSGMDLSEHAAGIAAQRLEPRGVRVRVGGVLDDPFPDETFDVVTMFDVIEHVPDLDAAFSAAKARVAPGGVLALSVPVYDGPVGVLVEAMDMDETHLHKYGRHDWVRRCEAAGLRVLRKVGIVRYFVGGRFYVHVQSRRMFPVSPAILLVTSPTGS